MTFRIPVPTGATDRERELLRTMERAGNTQGPLRLPLFTTTTLPPAATYDYCLAAVSDGASNKFLVISNGTAWYYAEGTAV